MWGMTNNKMVTNTVQVICYIVHQHEASLTAVSLNVNGDTIRTDYSESGYGVDSGSTWKRKGM